MHYMFSSIMADATVPLFGMCSILHLLKLVSFKQLGMAHQYPMYTQGVLVKHDLHIPLS